MNLSFSRILAILKKEFLQLRRDRATAAMVVMIPIVQLLLFGYAINNNPKHLGTAILSRDRGIFARSFTSGLRNSEYFHVNREIKSDAEGRQLLQRGEVHFVVTIPDNFSKDLIRGNNPPILIEADATDPTAIAGAVGAINGILLRTLSKDLKGPLHFLCPRPNSVNVIVHKMYNPEGFTNYNIIPGLIGVLLMLTGIMVTALSLTRERERGTMENMLSMPVRPVEVILGKIAPYVLIGYVQSAIIVIVAKFLFNIPILGSWTLLALALLLFIICNLALGLTISTVVKNQMQSLQAAVLVFLPSMMLSGFMFPFHGMPGWARIIGSCIPMTYFIRIVRGIMLKGSSFSELWQNFLPLLIFVAVTQTIAVKMYRKTLD